MPRYVAFLRAVNVGGRTIRMERLRDIFAAEGYSQVETFIASGNVIFESRGSNTATLEKKIETALQASLGYSVATFIRRPQDLDAIAEHQPFAIDDSGTPGGTIYIGFLRAPVSAGDCRKLLTFKTDVDDFDVRGQEVYWLVKGKLLDSKLSGPVIERTLGPTTMRNRNTIVRLAAKLRLA
jgi:uncharacterized protein (DUF1697 family)